MSPLMTGTEVGLLFTYEDGSTGYHGSWTIPHDSNHGEMDRIGGEIGWHAVYEMAKQPSRTVVGVQIVRRPAT